MLSAQKCRRFLSCMYGREHELQSELWNCYYHESWLPMPAELSCRITWKHSSWDQLPWWLQILLWSQRFDPCSIHSNKVEIISNLSIGHACIWRIQRGSRYVHRKKTVPLYSLRIQQLSGQDHYDYDYGLRNLKAVLNMAGQLKRNDPTMAEEAILMRVSQPFHF